MEGLLYKKKEGKVPENITYAFSVACEWGSSEKI
jgi:hypothetical protein